MKRSGIVLFCLLLLAGTLSGLDRWGTGLSGEQVRTVIAQTLGRELNGILAVSEIRAANLVDVQKLAVQSEQEPENQEEEMIPVRSVAEAWDEAARETEAETVPSEVLENPVDVSLEFRNQTEYDIEMSSLPELPRGIPFRREAPTILIMHTHGSEAYAECADTGYRTQDPEKNVIRVGEQLRETLEERGYHVVHDVTLCDYPEYTGAYNRSRAVIEENLAAYPSIALVLDVHRDAVADENGAQIRLACEGEEETLAQLMLVVGTDAGGLYHPEWQENLSLAILLQGRLQRENPGLMRPLNLREERFNQDFGELSLLCEFGTSGNTLAEACGTAAAFGTQLANLLDRYCGEST